ncbi:hypothetical protein FQN60_017283 [Etheostoma spectabile]|uniref:Uncharacterized protein n=1 Tax=Etheostoma spectabile TaxID=54343 RepID=A0A5J5DF10_9PERO|nr:hypothetical protein FQN60_017283 [Etheostoma spectabile]
MGVGLSHNESGREEAARHYQTAQLKLWRGVRGLSPAAAKKHLANPGRGRPEQLSHLRVREAAKKHLDADKDDENTGTKAHSYFLDDIVL